MCATNKYNKLLPFATLCVILAGGCIARTSAILTGQSSKQDIYVCSDSGGVLKCSCNFEHDNEIFLIDSSFLESHANNLQRIHIDACKTVQFAANSIKKLNNLRKIKISNIHNLILDGHSLYWDPYNTEYHQGLELPKIQIAIEKTGIKTIATSSFGGRINDLIFDGVTLENIDAFAFSKLTQTESIVFKFCTFVNVQSSAFKKFSTDYLTFLDSKLDALPSRAFSNVRVNKQLKIYRCSMDLINPGAFTIDNVEKFEMSESTVNVLEGEGFKVSARGNVVFKDNVFNTTRSGAFLGFRSKNEDLKLVRDQFVFDRNVLNHGFKDSLKINETSFEPKFTSVIINVTCGCAEIDNWWWDQTSWTDEVFCHKDATEDITVQDFIKYNCTILKSYATYFIVGGAVIALLIIVATILVIYFRRRYQQQKKAVYNTKNGKQNMGLIVPDGRTYRETELHVIVERADLLTTDL